MARTARKAQIKTDLLIVGGGITGMAAIAETRRRGISAICLEAASKVGGRIRTVHNRRIASYPIELGAEFAHGPRMKELCEWLGLTLIKHPSDGDAFVDNEFHPLLPILDVFKRIRHEAAAHLAAGNDDRSVEEFLDTFVQNERQLPRGLTPHLLLQLIRNDYATRVSELGLMGLLAPDFDGYEENYRIAEGYEEVPRRLAAEGEVRCNHVATAVLRYSDRVDVLTNRGVFSGNAAIICLPVGVLQAGDVRFDPPLSHEKAAAIETISAGAAAKLILGFRRTKKGTTFWPATTPLLATSLATQLWWPTGWGYDDGRHFLASCLVGGAAVNRFKERDPYKVGLLQLAHMFGRKRVRQNALTWYRVKSWHDDPRIKGGYSSLPVGAEQDALRHLESPEDESQAQLFFAGEYVSRHPGSAHSAYQSGLDAVERVVAMRQSS
jgi:monoamine oxidase